MVLPLYLAGGPLEIPGSYPLPAWFLEDGGDIPPPSPGAMVVLTDRCSPDPERLIPLLRRLKPGSVLLDFERPATEQAAQAARAILAALPCPGAAPPDYAAGSDCALFLPPPPLHMPQADYLRPWEHREIWLEATLRQQTITVTAEGAVFSSATPADRPDEGMLDDTLLCRYLMDISESEVVFTLFDTPGTLQARLRQAAALGVTRAVGLYQELNGKL